MSWRELPRWKIAVLAGMTLLAVVGVYDALSNLPVVSGCAFYDNCPADLPAEPPTER